MILFHASTQIIKEPDTTHSRDNLDFGKGFYLTVNKEQAVRYAARFTVRGKPAYINKYFFDEDLAGYIVKKFMSYDNEWLHYVLNCRNGIDSGVHYDAVEGGVANDNIFNTVDLFFSGQITEEEALGRLKFEKPNHQLCILNHELIASHLHFIEFERV